MIDAQARLAELSDLLHVRLDLTDGRGRDYAELERFHYLAAKPATWAAVRVVRCIDRAAGRRVAGVGVLSYPTPTCYARERALGVSFCNRGERAAFVNQHLRTISRVVIHPQFRALGLAGLLVRDLIEICPTRWIESFAHMGRAHPLFEKAGMRRIDPTDPAAPVYYLRDRQEGRDG